MSETKCRIWEFSPWFPYDLPSDTLGNRCWLANGDQVMDAGTSPGEWSNDHVVPELVINDPNFDVDCFVLDAIMFVSKKLRDAMDIDKSDIQFLDVSTSKCAGDSREKEYKVMNVPVRQKVSTRDVDISSLRDFFYKSGDISKYAEVEYNIFYDEYFKGSLFCVDDLAHRILSEGCTGIRFLDPDYADIRRPMRFRTLRGIEEEGDWDPKKRVENTTLVERW